MENQTLLLHISSLPLIALTLSSIATSSFEIRSSPSVQFEYGTKDL